MSNLTANEQYMLELINRARLDPAAEAARQHISLNEGLKKGTISTTGKQALAGSDILDGTADHHSQWMLDHDKFQHDEGTTKEPINPFARMTTAGYDFSRAGENISWTGVSPGPIDAAAAIKSQFNSLFVDKGISGRGHRLNILESHFREAGVGQKVGDFVSSKHHYNSSMVTQDFGTDKSGHAFITGVVYSDTVKNDNFFSIGEQQTGVAVSAGQGGTAVSDTTGGGGGYELAVAASSGHWTLTFDDSVSVDVKLGSNNAKVDFVNGHEIWTTSSTASLSDTITALYAIGLSGITLTGGDVDEHITGNKGSNRLLGNGGGDTLAGGAGHDTLTGGLGDDHFVYKAASESGVGSSHRDTISDFDALGMGDDVIDLSALSGSYHYRGTAAFNGSHQVRVSSTSGGVLVHVSTDSDHTDEMTIFLAGAHTGDMSKLDFIL